MLENQTDSDKPIYMKEVLKGEQSNNKFKNIEKACSFWRVLWEGHNQRNAQVNSNTKADLVEEVREVMMLLFSGGKKRTCCKKVRPGVFRRMYINRSSHCGLREARPI